MSTETDAAMINMASQTLNTGLNYAVAGSMNRRALKYNREMYNRQRLDALTDWNMQNQYNSPQQQMARLKAAGLNPNLVYGTGSVVANSQSMPRQTDSKSWNPNAPMAQLDGASVIGSYLDTRMKNQTINNLKAQQQNLQMETLLKAAQRTATLQSVDTKAFQLERDKGLYPGSLQIQQATVDKIIQGMDLERQRNTRQAQMQGEQILNMIQQRSLNNLTMEQKNAAIDLMRKDARIKELDAQFADKGVRPNDSMIWKIVSEIILKVSGKSMWDLIK